MLASGDISLELVPDIMVASLVALYMVAIVVEFEV